VSNITYEVLIDWSGNGLFTNAGENVSARVLARAGITTASGRDQVRAGTPTRPGTAAFTLDNRSRDYSPENGSSPLAGLVGPGREVIIQATHLSTTDVLYRGFLDDYDVLPNRDDRAVQLTCIDALGNLANTTISTALYQGIRTGDAIGVILDEAGWTGGRNIDPGATIIPWWWEESTTAGEAIEKILNSEGLTATAFVGPTGNFVFRDRHSRILTTASNTPQATFRTLLEPAFSEPLVYNAGWRDIINSVVYQVEERRPGQPSVVWTSDATYTLANGQSTTISVQTNDPFLGAVTPVEDVDFTVQAGAVAVGLTRTSGASTGITLTATGATVITDLQLRATPVTVVSTVQVSDEDAASVALYGRRSGAPSAPWANRYDAAALAEIILAHRAERMPIVSMRVVSGTPQRIVQQLSRDLLDRVTIVEPEIGINADFWIEQIQHTATPDLHETVFGCEQIPSPPLDSVSTIFRFDVAGHGFNQGLLGH